MRIMACVRDISFSSLFYCGRVWYILNAYLLALPRSDISGCFRISDLSTVVTSFPSSSIVQHTPQTCGHLLNVRLLEMGLYPEKREI